MTLSGNLTHDELASATAALVANGWVDRQTRVIILDAGAYNPALGVAVAVQVAVEVTAAGRVRSSTSARRSTRERRRRSPSTLPR